MITVAIESAIRGGSLSIIDDGREITNWIGPGDAAKAECLLLHIDQILREVGLKVNDLQHVAVSAGPGSFTGIRIGLSTALGLTAGLKMPISRVSALEAMAGSMQCDDEIIVALPVGRNSVCKQSFRRRGGVITAESMPETLPGEIFTAMVGQRPGAVYLVHRALKEEVGSGAVDFGENLAYSIGIASLFQIGIATEPLFISKTL